ncbi:UV DNA damage repair endonuclease UvsE [Paenibacillus piri]|uniref:UV DNA damage repair endonuclease UvsE n=1 Tax=Paenibacillus piri TaxID=2547395 RepID=A0A4R5KQG9_9BACL|nr:UV DNA damage repair endonuclease UvsE [Paenibacillus piri]TDF97255.1 UV DNA damage repair endonuclease UvsE [Paenibacillus piri]
MIVRLGYVAMSTLVSNASPSKTMTATSFAKLEDREAAVRKLERIAAENVHNTLRLLKHNRAYDIQLYRCSSRLIPLLGHELLNGWDPMPALKESFAELGGYAREHRMRLSFHPDHFTVLNTPRDEVLRNSILDLERHTAMLEAMGLDESAKCNIHIGGTYGSKQTAGRRFVERFLALPERLRSRLTLENDDKTFNASETLHICEEVGAPMVLDVHHHNVNHPDTEAGENAAALWPRILRTWEGQHEQGMEDKDKALPPKIHVSSPKSDKEVRSHADYIDATELLRFLKNIVAITPRLDIMIEAKKKDEALLKLMDDIRGEAGVRLLGQASFEL